MMRRKSDFKNRLQFREEWYDFRDDWDLIESSIAKQYGIRIRQNKEMTWGEFCTLVSGLMGDTPLGQIVQIRSEKDAKVIKGFNAEQRRIQSEWRTKLANKRMQDPEQMNRDTNELSKMFEKLFTKGG